MNRRAFAGKCLTCLSGTLTIPLLNRCGAVHYATGSIEENRLSVSTAEFTYIKKDRELVRPYIIVRNDALQFPIYLYRFGDNQYSALLMKCTHQGNELNASGDHLTCPAHGSEFTNLGIVSRGPAEDRLRSFKVVAADDRIFIDLKA
ncbi:MAG TPA: Rieske (2Fe-2S) protein [Chryseosolibacter sp.]|jgi:Rieske Fe-S protein|nr:Rieske (2Fe-2S) protein [Chryseosolibacter sp.]